MANWSNIYLCVCVELDIHQSLEKREHRKYVAKKLQIKLDKVNIADSASFLKLGSLNCCSHFCSSGCQEMKKEKKDKKEEQDEREITKTDGEQNGERRR